MDSLKDNSKYKIAQDIIKCLKEKTDLNFLLSIKENKRKIIIRRTLQHINKYKHLVVLEQNKPETQKWEIAYAEITLFKRLYDVDYKYIGFDIHFNFLEGIVYQRIFVYFSFHALLRLIERYNIQELSTPTKIKSFLSSVIKPILLRCLSMYEDLYEDTLEDFKAYNLNDSNTKEKIFKKRESYIVVNDLFMPIAMEIEENFLDKTSFVFTIKTVMPVTFNGAKRTIQEMQQKELKEKIFDYSYLLKALVK